MRDTTSSPGYGTAAPPRRWRRVVDAADAVVVPAPLARRVADVLRVARLDGGIFTDTGGRTWTFLTTRIDGTRSELLQYLDHIDVRVVTHATPPPAPADAGSDGTWWWITAPPRTGALLPWQAVLATVWRLTAAPDDRRASPVVPVGRRPPPEVPDASRPLAA